MKKFLLLGIGGILVLGALITNIISAIPTLDKINASNFFMCLVAFILGCITAPAGLLGIILLIIGFNQLKKDKKKQMDDRIAKNTEIDSRSQNLSIAETQEEIGKKGIIKKDRQLLSLFFSLWILFHVLSLQFLKYRQEAYPVLGILAIICLTISAVYIFKTCRWFNFSKVMTGVITATYFIFAFILLLISIVIYGVIIWKSKKLIKVDVLSSLNK